MFPGDPHEPISPISPGGPGITCASGVIPKFICLR